MKSVEGDLDNAPQNILSNITFEDAFKGKFFVPSMGSIR